MKIYTKSGDLGETSLWGGGRVKKSHPRVSAYGTLDEANSMLGLALTFIPSKEGPIIESLTRIQNELFQLGAELATPSDKKTSSALITEAEISRLEQEIDEMEKSLPALKNFILPGGGSAGATVHIARTIIRRAERECVEFTATENLRPEVVRYLNRLSDFLFVSARFVNHAMSEVEVDWIPKKN